MSDPTHRRPRYRALIVAAAAALLPLTAQADTDAGPQIVRQVQDAARALLEQQAARMGLVEPRIAVTVQPPHKPPPSCAGRMDVEAQDVKSPSRMRFVVTCADASGWSRKVLARARISGDVVVAVADVPAGRPLADADVGVESRDVTAIADFFADPAEVVGMTGRRALHTGDVLRRRLLAAEVMVRRGDPVRIVARNRGIEVQMAGEALDSGATDELVRVRNLSSGTVLRARVTGAGEVEPAMAGAQ